MGDPGLRRRARGRVRARGGDLSLGVRRRGRARPSRRQRQRGPRGRPLRPGRGRAAAPRRGQRGVAQAALRSSGFRVIHLATHALVDETSLARTALALAPGGWGGRVPLAGGPRRARARRRSRRALGLPDRRWRGDRWRGDGRAHRAALRRRARARSSPRSGASATRARSGWWRISTAAWPKGLTGGRRAAEGEAGGDRPGARRPSEWAGFTVVGDPVARVAAGESADAAALPGGWPYAGAASCPAGRSLLRETEGPKLGPPRGGRHEGADPPLIVAGREPARHVGGDRACRSSRPRAPPRPMR